MSYMNSSTSSWGYSSPQQQVANKVDHIADKIGFALDMANNQIIGIDGIEAELRALATGQNPPRPEQLTSLAGRLNSLQNQLKDNFTKVKQMTLEIDKTTDVIQTGSVGGWGV